jgi:Hemerythrin HHE cation binding domain
MVCMRRHPALEALSRDHHHALVVAQRLRRATADTAEDAREGFLKFWAAEGSTHFREEEEVLLPVCAEFIDPEHHLIAKVLTDHVWIRRLARRVRLSPDPELLAELGERLEQHVRLEERELFVLIEQAVPEEALVELAELLRS